MKHKGLMLFLCLMALSISAHKNTHAAGPKDFTNADLMSFTVDQRHAYYTGSMITMSHAISMYDKEKGQCFSDWFFSAPNKRIEEIEGDVKKYPKKLPSVIMMSRAALQCGKVGVVQE